MDRLNLVLTVILPIVTLFVGIFIAKYYSTRSTLKIGVSSLIGAFDIEAAAKNKLEILYEGKTVEKLWIIRFAIINSGNRDIISTMVNIPPKIIIKKDAEILSWDKGYSTENSDVYLEINDDSSVQIMIESLPRKGVNAFQLVARSQEKISIKPKDISVDRGFIIDTDVKKIQKSSFIIFKPTIKEIMISLMVMSVGILFIFMGVLILLYPNTANSFTLELSEMMNVYTFGLPLIFGIMLLYFSVAIIGEKQVEKIFEAFDETEGEEEEDKE